MQVIFWWFGPVWRQGGVHQSEGMCEEEMVPTCARDVANLRISDNPPASGNHHCWSTRFIFQLYLFLFYSIQSKPNQDGPHFPAHWQGGVQLSEGIVRWQIGSHLCGGCGGFMYFRISRLTHPQVGTIITVLKNLYYLDIFYLLTSY